MEHGFINVALAIESTWHLYLSNATVQQEFCVIHCRMSVCVFMSVVYGYASAENVVRMLISLECIAHNKHCSVNVLILCMNNFHTHATQPNEQLIF